MSQMSPAWQQGPRALGEKSPNDRHTSSSDSDSGCPQEEGATIASGFTPAQVPTKGATSSPSGRNLCRISALLCQLPPQDSDERFCTSLAEEEREKLQHFCIQRRLQSLGQGNVQPVTSVQKGSLCERCGRRIPSGGLAVQAARHGGQSCWHQSCFVCYMCEEPLFDLLYFHHHGQIYCGRHHAELFRPRCASCDQLIFTEELTEAEGWYWHLRHFCCTDCGTPLGGQRYVMKGGQPYCCVCFESTHAEACHTCGDAIGLDCEWVTHQGRHWHERTCCFRCHQCQRPLMGQDFLPHDGLLLCSAACSTHSNSSGSDSSDSACLSAQSPVSRRPFRGNGHALGARPLPMNPMNSSGGTRSQQGARTKLKKAWNSSRILSSGDQGMGTHRAGLPGCSSSVPAMEALPVSTQGHVVPERSSRVREPDTLWCSHNKKNAKNWDGSSSDGGSADGSQAPATAHDSIERTPGERSQKQDSSTPKASFTSISCPGHHNFGLENMPRSNQGPLHPRRSNSHPGPPGEGSEASPTTLFQQHQRMGSSECRTQHCTDCSTAPNNGVHIHRTEGSLKEVHKAPHKMATQDQANYPTHTREEATRCPTCSSSSDSEQEGFFLGRPIPRSRVGGDPSEKAGRLSLKASPRSKECTLS